MKYTNGSAYGVTLPRRHTKQFKALNAFAGKRFTFTEIQNWAIRENGMEGKVTRGYWCVNLTDWKYGLLTRYAQRHHDGRYSICPAVVAALNFVNSAE